MSNTKEKKTSYTPEQEEVIGSRGKNLLVSASAGSGKTTTMIERIAGLIADGISVTDILALTFTKAAAAEMREKLWNKLLAKAGENENIKEQLGNFPLANIGTIHSFCGELLRANFQKAGLDPAFAVIEGIPQKMLFAEALEETLEKYYQENSPEFYSLLDAFGKKRTDNGLKTVVKKIYECAVNTSSPAEWLKSAPDFYGEKHRGAVTDILNARYIRAADFYCAQISELLELCRSAEMKAHTGALVDLLTQIDGITEKNSFETNYNLILAVAFKTLPSKKPEHDAALAERIKSCKAALAETVRGFQAEFCEKSVRELFAEREQSAEKVRVLSEITQKLTDTYTEKKHQINALDFSDLEHAVNKLMEDGAVKEELANRYKFVFVDEYQDVNELQESILRKLSTADNRFMVGDIKQSIYAFRHSDPEIIKERMNEFADGAGGLKVSLSRNFRSHPDILDFVNFIFDNIMTEDFGGADYQKEHRLVYPGDESRAGEPRVSVDIVTGCKNEFSVWNDSLPMPYDINEVCAEEEFPAAHAEAVVIANKIGELVSKGLAYRDIVILTRSQTAHAYAIFEKLKSLGIPVSFPPEKMPDGNAELETLLNFLSVINNPLQDIPLAAALGSFMYNFTAADLIEISVTETGEKDADFFTKLTAYAETPAGGKAKIFLSELMRYRQLAKSVSAAELLTMIINEKSAEKYIRQKAGGNARADALLNFLSALREGGYAASLEGFCAYIELYGVEKVYSGGGEEDSVRMQSIHASKGLEYPAVILAGLGARERHDTDEALVDKDSGIAVNFYDTATRQKTRTLNKCAAKAEGERRDKEEALRVLYVGLTRAKEYLCLTGCVNKFPEADHYALHPYALSECGSFIDLITAVIANRNNAGFKLTKTDKSTLAAAKGGDAPSAPVFSAKDKDLTERLKTRMDYKYPFAPAMSLEFKMAASEAAKQIEKGLFRNSVAVPQKAEYIAEQGEEKKRQGTGNLRSGKQDKTVGADFDLRSKNQSNSDNGRTAPLNTTEVDFAEHSAHQASCGKENGSAARTEFLEVSRSGVSESVSEIDTGTFYHKALRYMNLGTTDTAGELARLAGENILTAEEVESIDTVLLDKLLGLDIIVRAARNKHFREQPFMMLLPAAEIDSRQDRGDNVIIQGIVDLMFFEDDGIVIVDYKYSSLSADALINSYAGQLNLYARAAESILKKPVTGKYIVSIRAGEVIKI